MDSRNPNRRTRVQRLNEIKSRRSTVPTPNAYTPAVSTPRGTNSGCSPEVCSQNTNPVEIVKICTDTTGPSTPEGKALSDWWDLICPNFDPDYPPFEPVKGEPYCVQCLPANAELQIIFSNIADLLEL